MKKFFLLLLLLSGSAFAINSPTVNTAQAQLAPGPDVQKVFDRLPGIPASRKYALGRMLLQAHNTAVCVYDFATQGGLVGNINLLAEDLVTPCTLPGKAVIRNGLIDVSTTVTSGGSATLALSSGATAGDLLGATAKASFTGQLLTIPVFATVGTYLKLATANSIINGVSVNAYQPYLTVGTADLTAGHFRLFIDYVRGE